MPASTLAQSIPSSADNQRVWLSSLERWVKHVFHHFHEADLFLCWAVMRFRELPTQTVDITDIADFAGNNRATFNAKWTLLQAKAASDRWHAEVVRKSTEAEFLATHRIGWRDTIDYSPLPLRCELRGFEFIALQSAEQIFVAGHHTRHCVSTYLKRVVAGQSRLFSIRCGQRRLATLELNPVSVGLTRGCSIGQLRGPCNAEPSVDVLRAADSFVAQLNEKLAVYVQEPASQTTSHPPCETDLLISNTRVNIYSHC